MDITEKLWTAFNDIYFEPDIHRYTDSKGTKYTSVTGFLSRFEPEVDWDAKAQNSAKKRLIKEGIEEPNSEQIKNKAVELQLEWGYSGDYAKALGTEIHAVLENLWYRKDYAGDKNVFAKFEGMEKDFNERKGYCKQLFDKMKKFYIPVKNEFIVYDADNALCGTIDFLAYNTKTKAYSIIDWKTSKEFNSKSFDGVKLKYPFENFEACNINEYSIQLSTYAYILEKYTDIKINEMILFQIPKITTAATIVRCNDMRPYLKKILK